MENRQAVAPTGLLSAIGRLSLRVKRLRDQFFSFYERDYTNEVRSYATDTPWDVVYPGTGYNAYFIGLGKEIQDEIIARESPELG